jgi:hypothetical protein
VCFRTKSNMRRLSISKTEKANVVFAFAVVVGADGFEPPTYAL